MPDNANNNDSQSFTPYFDNKYETSEGEYWIESDLELDDDNFIYNITKSVCILSASSPQFTNTDDGISLIYPQLVDWDQQGPPVLETF